MPPAAKAVASGSKFVNACTITSGEHATSPVSHTRRPDSIALAQTVTSHASANPTATTLK